MVVFGAIGLSGFLPNLATQWLLTRRFGMYYAAAAVVANQVAIVWNFLLIDHVLFRHRRRRHWSNRLGKFMLLSNADLVIRIPLLAVLVEYAGLNDILSTAATLVLAFVARFAVTDRVIYLPRPEKTTPKSVPADIT
jgi:dolichol-phosphate mannosyltransferase